MAKRELRFGVRDVLGRCAATWNLTFVPRPNEPQVYLICRCIPGTLKTSFHPKVWRHAYIGEAFSRLFEDMEHAPDDRCIEEWPRPEEHGPGVTWALRILVPWSAPNAAIAEEDKRIFWIRSAPEPRWVEIDIFFLREPHARIDPATSATEFEVIATEPLGNGELIHLMHQTIDPPTLDGLGQGSLRFFRGKSGEDLRTGPLSVLGFAVDSKGVRVVVDGRVEVAPSALDRLNGVRQT